MSKETKGVRLVCDLPHASHTINGIRFVTIRDGDTPLHVSERVSPEVAEPLTTIPGYQVYAGDQDELIEQALAVHGASQSGETPADPSAELRRENEELQRANHAMSRERDQLRGEVARLTDELAKAKTAATTPATKAPETAPLLDAPDDTAGEQVGVAGRRRVTRGAAAA